MSGEPIRTCSGCGRKAPQSELLRFAAVDGVLQQGRTLSGRGAYTCRRLLCFERAVSRRAFNRVLRKSVHVDPALRRLYTRAATEAEAAALAVKGVTKSGGASASAGIGGMVLVTSTGFHGSYLRSSHGIS